MTNPTTRKERRTTSKHIKLDTTRADRRSYIKMKQKKKRWILSNIRKGLQTSIRGKLRPRTKQKKYTTERVIRVNLKRR